ncbi:hypothetical protein HHI36_004569 [Cryptolaemus montrouzieri]|uniref:Uncharacterized protein n=1 Tax=Cryptolaemus montrouzieri TaxID=559131 RepID=A0ABD2NS88_9CUCU
MDDFLQASEFLINGRKMVQAKMEKSIITVQKQHEGNFDVLNGKMEKLDETTVCPDVVCGLSMVIPQLSNHQSILLACICNANLPPPSPYSRKRKRRRLSIQARNQRKKKFECAGVRSIPEKV